MLEASEGEAEVEETGELLVLFPSPRSGGCRSDGSRPRASPAPHGHAGSDIALIRAFARFESQLGADFRRRG